MNGRRLELLGFLGGGGGWGQKRVRVSIVV